MTPHPSRGGGRAVRAWCIKTPKGRLLYLTIAPFKEEAWDVLAMCPTLGPGCDYSKTNPAWLKSAKAAGYRCVRVRVEEEAP